jgi:hypothetical protein
MKKLYKLIFTFILAACSPGASSEFEGNLEKWRDAGITRYRYSLSVGCFCAFRDRMPLTAEVRQGEVVSLVYADGTALSPADADYEFLSRYAPMEGLFAVLEAGLSGEADEVTVTYDPAYGFPRTIHLDVIEEAIDDELSLEVTNFEVVE